EMDRVVETTAISPVIREQSDQFPLIADRHGRMVIGQFGSAISTILRHSPYEASDLRDGDVIALNDPYLCEGAISHWPYFLILRPIFYEDDLVGYASQWGNLMDVGGTAPGSMPRARSTRRRCASSATTRARPRWWRPTSRPSPPAPPRAPPGCASCARALARTPTWRRATRCSTVRARG